MPQTGTPPRAINRRDPSLQRRPRPHSAAPSESRAVSRPQSVRRSQPRAVSRVPSAAPRLRIHLRHPPRRLPPIDVRRDLRIGQRQ